MKKLLVLFVLFAFVLTGLVACKGESSASNNAEVIKVAKAYSKKTCDMFNAIGDALKKAKTGKEAASVIVKFQSDSKNLMKEGAEFKKKYPKFDGEKVPELKGVLEKVKKATMDFFKIMNDVNKKFAKDKDFVEAIKKAQGK